MKNAVQLGMFKGFKINEGPMISHLQFADDTILVGDATVENLWGIKAVLRSFELVSGMKVNFHKSKLIGVNVQHDFMDKASDFLHCRIGSLPFQFLGIPVGASPRKTETWKPMIEALKSRLGG